MRIYIYIYWSLLGTVTRNEAKNIHMYLTQGKSQCSKAPTAIYRFHGTASRDICVREAREDTILILGVSLTKFFNPRLGTESIF
jgi:hypothetical protein